MKQSRRGQRHVARPARPRPGIETASEWATSGLCDEAQADGVPCAEPGRVCETCERAHLERKRPLVSL